MQTIGHVIIKNQLIKLLVRPNIKGGYVSLKIRKGGGNGQHLEDEQIYLSSDEDALKRLLLGKVIKL